MEDSCHCQSIVCANRDWRLAVNGSIVDRVCVFLLFIFSMEILVYTPRRSRYVRYTGITKHRYYFFFAAFSSVGKKFDVDVSQLVGRSFGQVREIRINSLKILFFQHARSVPTISSLKIPVCASFSIPRGGLSLQPVANQYLDQLLAYPPATCSHLAMRNQRRERE